MGSPSSDESTIVAGAPPDAKGRGARWQRGVYLVTAAEKDSGRLLAVVEAALDAGAALVQYRDKSGDAALRRAQASAVLALCRRHGVPMLVNDDVALAVAVGAEGVHLGRDDMTLEAARAALGPAAIIGVSCYSDPVRARRLVAAGADYVAFGSMYPSSTKPHAPRADLSVFKTVANLGVPRVAIGGIDVTNARNLTAAGADLLAVIGAIFDAPDPRSATLAIAAAFD
jgi:thiamine-phosphate pyrophosphorylase